MKTAKNLSYTFLLLNLLYFPLFAHAALIELSPESIEISPGNPISIDVNVSGLGDLSPTSVGAFDVWINYDPLDITFLSYSFGNYLGDISLFEASDFSWGDLGGLINLSEVSFLADSELDALQPSMFTLATLVFDVNDLQNLENTNISVLSDSILSDGLGSEVSIASFGIARVKGGAVSEVPSPSPILLILSSLAFMRISRIFL